MTVHICDITQLSTSAVTAHKRHERNNQNDCYLVISSHHELKQNVASAVPVHIVNRKGEDVVFQEPTLLKIESSAKLSLSDKISIENEETFFDEEINKLTIASIESDITVPQGFVLGIIT